ncbi:hypothetical protein ACFL5W_01650 [Thermodesulfobacteriota bacterium]
MKGFFQRLCIISQVVFILIIPMLIGCDRVYDKANEFINHGTNLGFKICVDQNEEVGLEKDVVRNLCLKKHQKLINPKIDGGASYNCKYGICEFKVWLKNNSDNVVITSLKLDIKHKDNKDKNGNIIAETILIDNLWIEPNSSDAFSSYELKFQPKPDRIENSMFSWNITQVKGLKIRLK